MLALALLAGMAALALLHKGYTPDGNVAAGKQRIVSLAPSITETLFALGLGDRVVGVTEYCTYPPEATKIERVGGFSTPNLEKLLALSPTLVIGNEGAPANVVGLVKQSGASVLELRKVGSFEDIFDGFMKIGRAAGAEEQARKVVAAMRQELDAAAAPYKDLPAEKRPRVFVEIWHDPITTAGAGSFVDELITRAGGVNVAHELTQAHPNVSPEKVIEWDPDVIIVAYMAKQGGARAMAGRIGWGGISAVKAGRVIDDISTDYLLRPGPRLVEGVKILAQRLHSAEAGKKANE